LIRYRGSFVRPFQVIHISIQELNGVSHEFSSATKEFCRNKTFVVPCDQMIENFPTRTSRIATELRVFQIMEPTVSFSNVSRGRTYSPQQLIA